MIKVNSNHKELRMFNQYLDECLKRPRTEFKLYEFLLAENIEALAYRVKKKVSAFILDEREEHAKAKLQIEFRELAALSIYFNRFKIYPFLTHLEREIISKMPGEVIDVCTYVPVYEADEETESVD